ncbi:IS110 family transposase [Xylanimonas oleitrophica]|uniref:IS110 family transposase n=1 Tax=Xylanimonas oleitrophica TaxID=2607479 RepID=A0A2W5WIX5_9MICO|nr:IS110 family transposase [Xylanimonas oleitrophica]PZR51509.1 IS110 family transposase [Xylanimonas oleitrophica]
MFTERTSVGLDVHARSIRASALDSLTGELFEQTVAPGEDYRPVMAWIARLPGPVAVAYEAGPTGFGLARVLGEAGIRCTVAAPSKINRAPGDRVKTDARDARLLARLLRVEDLSPVVVPTIEQESARDLVRLRFDNRSDLMSARHRLGKLLLRHGHVYCGGRAWTRAHEQWMNQIRFTDLGTRVAFSESRELVTHLQARRDRLDEQIAVLAASSSFAPVVTRLCCLRGIATLTGFALAVEVGDWTRFTGSSIGAFLGLTPTEHSSGGSRRQGGITKAGNTHARRLLIESAWLHKPRYVVGKVLQERWDAAPAAARVRADEGNRRLHHRWVQFETRGKKHTVATTAIARELAGWCWSLAVLEA